MPLLSFQSKDLVPTPDGFECYFGQGFRSSQQVLMLIVEWPGLIDLNEIIIIGIVEL